MKKVVESKQNIFIEYIEKKSPSIYDGDTSEYTHWTRITEEW